MRHIDALSKLLSLFETLYAWGNSLGDLKGRRRDRVARYVEEIAGCLGRLGAAARAQAHGALPRDDSDLIRELGRLTGYVEDVADALKGHVDGRRIAGVKRRLAGLAAGPWPGEARIAVSLPPERLLEAEGYMRALADRLRA